jgi:hypothetical protein
VDEQLDLDGFESYERLGAGDGAGVARYSAPRMRTREQESRSTTGINFQSLRSIFVVVYF